MAVTLAVFLCLGSGWALVSTAWPRMAWQPTDLLFRASLSAGFGLGIFSCVLFFVRLFGSTHLLLADLEVFVVLLAVSLLRRQRPATFIPQALRSATQYPAWSRRLIAVAFMIALCVAAYSAVVLAAAYPHGNGWDAFAIWNLRARFLFLGGHDHWRDGFTPLLAWSHPDYPLLLPAAIAHFWNCLGHDSAAVAVVIGLSFIFATTAILFSAVTTLRNPTQAMLATTLLLATPAFVEQGTAQYADVPLSFFFLAAISLLALSKEQENLLGGSLPLLSGIAAGFAAWTKNEGLLFAESFLLANLFGLVRAKYASHEKRRFLLVLTGSLPLLILIFCYKHWIAGPGDMFSTPSLIHDRLMQPARYRAVLEWFAKDFFRFGDWFVVPGTILLTFYFLVNRTVRADCASTHQAAAQTVLLTFAGYFFIYLITPRDIYWHLRFSLDRLFLQLWPSVIFLSFVNIIPSPLLAPDSSAVSN